MYSNTLPYIERNHYGVSTLYVHEKPFLMLGGELHNSAASNLEHMETAVWPYIRPFGLNTVILPIAWENLEPVEDIFDFTLLDGILAQARREQVRIVLLWFGLWKNGESFYVPSWVKQDYERFFRSRYYGGIPSDTISPFCQAAVAADQKAFVKLMEHLKEADGEENTVILVQVENEIGFLKSDRDYSETANAAFHQEIPADLSDLTKKQGTWKEVFGADAEEMFMAYHYAKDVETIASSGKKAYNLPMYVNAWLEQHPDRPGEYPTGGPVAKLVPFWRIMAPSLDLIAPDIYVPFFKDTCESYMVDDNPLFIPEARRDPITASNMFYAFGGLNALGFSPFAVEDFLRDDIEMPDLSLLTSLNIDMSGFNCIGTGPYFKRSCEVMNGILPIISELRGSDRLIGFIRNGAFDRGTILSMDGYDLQLDYRREDPAKTGTAGLIIKAEKGFYICGCNVSFKPLPEKGSHDYVTMVRLEEGEFVHGEWKSGRILNGDELNETSLGAMAECKYVEVCVHR